MSLSVRKLYNFLKMPQFNGVPFLTAQDSVGTGLATTGTVTIDFATLTGTKQAITLTGNPTFASSNPAQGRWITIFIKAGASTRTLAWPSGWIPSGGLSSLPTSLASGKVAIVSVFYAFGATDADAVVAYSVQG